MNVHANILNMRKIINLYYEMIERRLNPTINIHKLCLKAAIEVKDLITCQYILLQIKSDHKIKFDMKCWQLVLSFIQQEIHRYNNNNDNKNNNNDNKNNNNNNNDNNNNNSYQQKDDVYYHDLDSNNDNNHDDHIIKEYNEYEIIIKNEMMLNNKRENNKYYASPQ
jgi:hypothetical protein